MKNYRLDAYLHDKGYVTSRERSKQLILGKFVYVDDKLITKPSYPVKDGVKIEITGNLYISRGYLKIEKAVRAFNISPENKTAVDIGASTGGFTEYLLKHGAKKVYAIDVGRGQLHDTLKNDPRVINLENTNFIYFIFEPVNFFVFIYEFFFQGFYFFSKPVVLFIKVIIGLKVG
jgi:23S rRNA (cytidine1920-2'-O)/16S rRNA (cytidine1409-2'-O)-methyltransferase